MEATIDQVFEWGEELGRKAKEIFGSHRVEVSLQTFFDMQKRCSRIEIKDEDCRFLPAPQPLNSISVYINPEVPDGIVRGCARQ